MNNYIKFILTKKKIIIALIVFAGAIWGIVKYYSHSNVPAVNAVWVQVSKVKESSLPLEAHAIGTITAKSK